MFTINIQFSEEIGKLEDKVERANNALKADWDRWKQNMQWDMRSTFTNVAENNLRYYEEVKFFLKKCYFFIMSVKKSWGKSMGSL